MEIIPNLSFLREFHSLVNAVGCGLADVVPPARARLDVAECCCMVSRHARVACEFVGMVRRSGL